MNERPRDHRTRTTGWIGKAGKASSRLKIPETRPSLGEERAENWYYLYVCTSCCLVGWLVGWLAGDGFRYVHIHLDGYLWYGL